MKKNLFPICFLASLVIITIGAYIKITHQPGAETMLIAGAVISAISLIIGIYEVRASKTINTTEKTLWTVGFIFLNFFTSIIYLFKRRQIVR